jgi:hypothetical protein
MKFRNAATSRYCTEDGIPMSDQPSDDHNQAAEDKLKSNALRPVSFDRFDKINNCLPYCRFCGFICLAVGL